MSLRRHRRDALTPQLRKRSVATDGGRIPQVGWPRIVWNRERSRALLSVGKRCNPLKKGVGSRLVELWAAEQPDLPATANALVQKFRLIRKTLVQTELACTIVKQCTAEVSLTHNHQSVDSARVGWNRASLKSKVAGLKRSNQGNLNEFEKSVSEDIPLLRRYYTGQIRNNPGDFKTRGWYPTSSWSPVGNKTA